MSDVAEAEERLEASVSGAFDLIAWEIELAGARCIKLDSLIGALIDQIPPDCRERLVEGLHTVDLLSQHLTGISAFTRELGGSVAPEARLPYERALQQVTLGALADRMSTALGGEEKGFNDGDDAGDLDLF
jgi:hypothetical protein